MRRHSTPACSLLSQKFFYSFIESTTAGLHLLASPTEEQRQCAAVWLRPFGRLLKRFSGSHSFSCANLDLYISTGFLDQKTAWHDGKNVRISTTWSAVPLPPSDDGPPYRMRAWLARRFNAYDSFNLERGVQSWKEWMHCPGGGEHRKDFGNISMKRLDFWRVANLIMEWRDRQELSNILHDLERI
jgi:hypothetical protein